MAITDFLERNARIYPNDISLVELNPANRPDVSVSWREYSLTEASSGEKYRRDMTWREFDVKANRFANLLLTRGIKRGDKVAILLMNCIEWLPIYFGILKTGALAVPLNFRYTADEIEYCLNLVRADALVFGPEFVERVEEVAGNFDGVNDYFFVGEKGKPAFAGSYEHLVGYCSSIAPAVEICEEDDAAIYFSSGTTGRPKAILHNHGSLTAAAKTEQNHHSQTREDVFLCIPPLYHTGAKMHWFGSLMVGGKAILLRGVSPQWVLQTVSDERATLVWLLVPWAQDILDAIERGEVNLDDYRLSQWRLMHIGAQPVPPSLIKRWMKIFPNHEYDTNYGLSESSGPGCVHLGVENIHKVGAIGKAGYLWQTDIVDEKGKSVSQGQVGELAVKGPGVMKGYVNNPEATAEILKDGWLYTGDMARADGDGFIYLVDRKKDVIISGGENIYPVQIEDFLRSHEKIADVAVIGLPDQRLGEISAAVVQVKVGFELDEKELEEFCMELPRYKRPRKYIFADVPRNPTGKIEKPKLREKYCAGRLVEEQTTN
ncbi:MAG: acyl--CoA ligase [Clostridiales bacterium]|nr:acyl--CoA ligase [Clostridiales bacterium]